MTVTAPDSTALDSTALDSTALDSTALDSTALDSTALDSTALDSTALDSTAPATIADITDPRLRAVVVHAFLTVVEDTDGEGVTAEAAWVDMPDERDMVVAAAQACIDALDALAPAGSGQKSLLGLAGHSDHLRGGGGDRR